MLKRLLTLVVCALSAVISFGEASHSVHLVVKRPFVSEHYDTTGNVISDSLARGYPIRVTVLRSEEESLSQTSATDDSGSAAVVFSSWADQTPVDSTSITRMAVSFPNTREVVGAFGRALFEPMQFDSVDFKQTEVTLVLPPTVSVDEFTIGEGAFNVCNFAVVADMHIGENNEPSNNQIDFEGSGWDDSDNRTQSYNNVVNDSNVLGAIAWESPDFIVLLGDITTSSERSEYERALALRKYFASEEGLDCPWVPVIGNHDLWPYCQPNSPPEPQPGETEYGEYFWDADSAITESLSLSLPNWELSLQKHVTVPQTPQYETYCFPGAFDFQGARFVLGDFNSRSHVPSGWNGVIGSAELVLASYLEFAGAVREARSHRNLIVLAHHPLAHWSPWIYNDPFRSTAIDSLAGVGENLMRDYGPVPSWIGGHFHGGWGHCNRDTLIRDGGGNSTVSRALTLVHAAKEGWYGWFRVYDDVKAEIQAPTGGPLAVTQTFAPNFLHVEGEDAPARVHWDLGDGTAFWTSYGDRPAHTYHLYDNHDTLFKATLEVETNSGRLVTVSRLIHVVGSPYNLHAEYVHSDAVKLRWDFDNATSLCLRYHIWRDGSEIGVQNDPEEKCWTDDDVHSNETHTYRVVAEHSGGNIPPLSPAAEVVVSIPTLWLPAACIPDGPRSKNVKDGGALAGAPGLNDAYVYALKGNNTTEFYRYSVSNNAWQLMDSIPKFDRTSRKKTVKLGGALASIPDGRVYAVKGNNTRGFWCYDPGSSWQEKCSAPAGEHGKLIKGGAGLAALKVHFPDDTDTNFVYLLKGSGTCEFYRYNVERDTWQQMADAPHQGNRTYKSGSCIACDPEAGAIYVLKGGRTEFYAYDALENAWTTRETLPKVGSSGRSKVAKVGACLAFLDGGVYALKGASTNDFFLYRPDNWVVLESMPAGTQHKSVRAGGALSAAAGMLWALRGSNTRDFYRCTGSDLGVSFVPPWVPPAVGQNEVQISACANATAETPTWSNDGAWVAFCRTNQGYMALHKAPANGGQATALTSVSGSCSAPTWSPDGSTIAIEYESNNGQFRQIAIVSSSGGQVTELTSDACDHENPDWVLAGNGLFYSRFDATTGYDQIYHISSSGGSEQAKSSTSYAHEKPQVLSSTEVICQRDGNDVYSGILKLNVNTGQEVELTSGSADYSNPSVAVGARLVACEKTDQDGFSQIVVFSADGGTETVVTSGSYDFESPSICYDGSVLSCIRIGSSGSAVCVIDLLEGTCQTFTDALADREADCDFG